MLGRDLRIKKKYRRSPRPSPAFLSCSQLLPCGNQNGVARHKGRLSFSTLAAEFPQLLAIASGLSAANEGFVDTRENLPPPAQSPI